MVAQLYIDEKGSFFMTTKIWELNAQDLGQVIEFEDPKANQVYTRRAILKAVMHDEKGSFIRYKDLTKPFPMEYAHYVDDMIGIVLYNYKPDE